MTSPETNSNSDHAGSSGDPNGNSGTDRAISEKVRRLFEEVPEIGTRWRWYDIPYRFFSWWLTSWRRELIPWRLRGLLNKGANFFMAFDQYERTKAEPLDDPKDNLILPQGEIIRQGGLWVVELFPPSHYQRLIRALSRSGWDDAYHLRPYGTNEELIRRAREGRGFSWSRIGAVVRSNTKFLVPDAKRENLPDEFEYVELHAVQIGTSLTALVAHFTLTDLGETSLYEVWHRTHEPQLEWQRIRRPHVINRYFASIRATQRERERIHDLGRRWLMDRCAGFFADQEEGQPVVDLNILDRFDPTTQELDRLISDSFRALGFEGNHIHNFVSDQMPGAVLMPVRSPISSSEPLQNCWGIVGQHERLTESSDRPGYGEKPYAVSTLGAMFDDAARAFLLHFAAIRYLEELRAQYSTSRDSARTRHGRFSARRINQLRTELLTTSLDLAAVASDTEDLWSERWRSWNGIDVKAIPAPGAPDSIQSEFDLIEHWGEIRAESFDRLLSDDETYRTVLATVASLGSSADATKMGRRALWVAALSLLVAITLLLVTEPGSNSLWSRFLEWLG